MLIQALGKQELAKLLQLTRLSNGWLGTLKLGLGLAIIATLETRTASRVVTAEMKKTMKCGLEGAMDPS
jgi:hypothetical protein